MSGYNVIRSNKGQKECRRDHNIHTQFHSAKVQFGTITWATAKIEKKDKGTSGVVNRTWRDIPYLTALGVRDFDR